MSDHIEVTITVTLDDYRTSDVYRLETCNPLSKLSDAAKRGEVVGTQRAIAEFIESGGGKLQPDRIDEGAPRGGRWWLPVLAPIVCGHAVVLAVLLVVLYFM